MLQAFLIFTTALGVCYHMTSLQLQAVCIRLRTKHKILHQGKEGRGVKVKTKEGKTIILLDHAHCSFM